MGRRSSRPVVSREVEVEVEADKSRGWMNVYESAARRMDG